MAIGTTNLPTHKRWEICFFILGILLSQSQVTVGQPFLGVKIGPLETLQHLVAGIVYAADDTHIIVNDFSYDGQGQDTFYWVGTTDKVGTTGGTPLEYFPYPKDGIPKKIEQVTQRGGEIRIRLPVGKTVKDYKYFSIYCRNAAADFGSIKIPASLQLPKPVDLGPFKVEAAGVTSVKSVNVILKDLRTIFIKGFTFNPIGTDAIMVIGSKEVGVLGSRVPDENGKIVSRLRKYDNEDITLLLGNTGTILELPEPAFEVIGIYTASSTLATLELPKGLGNLPVHFDETPRKIIPTVKPKPLGNVENSTATRNTPISNYIGWSSYMIVTLLTMGFGGVLLYA